MSGLGLLCRGGKKKTEDVRFPGKVNWVSRLRFQSKKKVLIETMQFFFRAIFCNELEKNQVSLRKQSPGNRHALNFILQTLWLSSLCCTNRGQDQDNFFCKRTFYRVRLHPANSPYPRGYVEGDRDSNPGLQVLCPFLHCLSGSFIANNVSRVLKAAILRRWKLKKGSTYCWNWTRDLMITKRAFYRCATAAAGLEVCCFKL